MVREEQGKHIWGYSKLDVVEAENEEGKMVRDTMVKNY